MIKINLYDYREEVRRIHLQKSVVKGGAIIAGFFALILLSWMFDQSQLFLVKSEIKELEGEVQKLEKDVQVVRTMQAKKKRIETIVGGIEKLREQQLPVTRILTDLNLRVPDDIWLLSIKQKTKKELQKAKVPIILIEDPAQQAAAKNKKRRKKKAGAIKEEVISDFIEINGQSFEEQAVARYVQQLESIPYFKLAFLYKTERLLIGANPVYEFVIYCYMPAIKPDKKAMT